MSLIQDFQVEFTQRKTRVKSLDLHPVEPWILVGQHSGAVEIWNYKSKMLETSFEVTKNVPVRSTKFIPQKQWIVTGSDDKMIRVYDYNTQEKVKEFMAHEDYIRDIVVHPNRPYMLSASDDHLIKLWNWEKDWTCARTFEGHSHYVMQMRIHPKDHDFFVSVSLDGSAKIWNVDNFNPIGSLAAHEKGVNCVNFLIGHAEVCLLTGSDDHTTKVWNYETLDCIKVLEGHTHNVTTILTHPQLSFIITGSEDNAIRVWNASTYELEKTLDQGLGRVWAIEFEKTLSQVFIGCDEGCLAGKFIHL